MEEQREGGTNRDGREYEVPRRASSLRRPITLTRDIPADAPREALTPEAVRGVSSLRGQ